jgi:hypothetical protein
MSKTALVIVGVGAACASVALVGSMTKIPFGAMSNAMQPKMEPRTIGSAVFLGFANITVCTLHRMHPQLTGSMMHRLVTE